MRIRDGQIVDRFSTFVNPGQTVSQSILQDLTHITEEQLRSGPGVREAINRFGDFAQGAVLVAHNAGFDAALFKRLDVDHRLFGDTEPVILDTLEMARRLLPGGVVENHQLGTLTRHFGIDLGDKAHRAIYDAEATASVFMHLLKLHAKQTDPALARQLAGFTQVGDTSVDPGRLTVDGMSLTAYLANPTLDALDRAIGKTRARIEALSGQVDSARQTLADHPGGPHLAPVLDAYTQLLGRDIAGALHDRLLARHHGGQPSGGSPDALAEAFTAIIDRSADKFTYGVHKGDQLDQYHREYRRDLAKKKVAEILSGEGSDQARMHQALDAVARHLILPSAEFASTVSLRAGAPIGGTGNLLAQYALDVDSWTAYKVRQGYDESLLQIGDTDYGIIENPLAMLLGQGDWDGDLKAFVNLEGMAQNVADKLAYTSLSEAEILKLTKGMSRKESDRFRRQIDQAKTKAGDLYSQLDRVRLDHGRGRVFVEFAASWIQDGSLLSQYDELHAKETALLDSLGIRNDADFDPAKLTDSVAKQLASLSEQRATLVSKVGETVQSVAGLFKDLSSHVTTYSDLLAAEVKGGLGEFFAKSEAERAQILGKVGDQYWSKLEAEGKAAAFEAEFKKLTATMGTPIRQSGEMLRFISEYTAASSGEVIGKAFNDTYAIHTALESIVGGAGISQSKLDIIAGVTVRPGNQMPRDMIKPKIGTDNPFEGVLEAMARNLDDQGRASGSLAALRENEGLRSLTLMHQYLNGLEVDYLNERMAGTHPDEIFTFHDSDPTYASGRYESKLGAAGVVRSLAEGMAHYMMRTATDTLSGQLVMLDRKIGNLNVIEEMSLQVETAGGKVEVKLANLLRGDLPELSAQARQTLKGLLEVQDADTVAKNLADENTRSFETMRQKFQENLILHVQERLSFAYSGLDETDERVQWVREGLASGELDSTALTNAYDYDHLMTLRETTMGINQYRRDIRQYGIGTTVDFSTKLLAFNQLTARSGQFAGGAHEVFNMLHDIAFNDDAGGTVIERLNTASQMDRSGVTRSLLEAVYLHTGVMTNELDTLSPSERAAAEAKLEVLPKLTDGPDSFVGPAPTLEILKLIRQHKQHVEELAQEGKKAPDSEAAAHAMEDGLESYRSVVRKSFLDAMGRTQTRTDHAFALAHQLDSSLQGLAEAEMTGKAKGWNTGMGVAGALISSQLMSGGLDAATIGVGVAMGLASASMYNTMQAVVLGARMEGADLAAFGAGMGASIAFDYLAGQHATFTGRLARSVGSMAIGAVAGAVVGMIATGRPLAARTQAAQSTLTSIFDAIGESLAWDGPDVNDEGHPEIFDEDGDPIEFMSEDEFVAASLAVD